MPDIYIEVGEMHYNSDTSKVGFKYTKDAKATLLAAAVEAIRATKGYTPDPVGTTPAKFKFDGTLDEIVFGTYQGMPSVTCRIKGTVETSPGSNKEMTASVSGSSTVAGGTTDKDVTDCMKMAMKKTVDERVIPYIKGK